MKPLLLELPFPPSVNHYWRHVPIGPGVRGVRTLISAKGRAYQHRVQESVAMQTGGRIKPLDGPVEISVTIHPPDRRRRDLDNCIKAMLDALTNARVWRDDSQVSRLHMSWGGVRRGGLARIKIAQIEKRGEECSDLAR